MSTTDGTPPTSEGCWLPDRQAFIDVVEEALDSAAVGPAAQAVNSVVLLEIESFDLVNETFGPEVGRGLIRCCADHLLASVHPGDRVAGFSDHAFAVWCSHVHSTDEAHAYGEHLRGVLGRPSHLPHVRLALRVSAAVAVATADTHGAEDLLRRSGTALLQARPHPVTKLYEAAMIDELMRRVELEAIVSDVVERGAVDLAYQPIVRLGDQQIVGAEALLRIPDGSGSHLPPAEVVHAAEQSGQIHELGDLILRTACEAAARWQRKVPDLRAHVAVNVSARQLDDPTLPQRVAAALAAAGLDAGSLWLEITESALMVDPGRSAAALADLRAGGVRLAADDFGTGYSSLAYLKTFPLDALKIDRSFVSAMPTGLQEVAITGAVIAIADALGLDVVAEGVESDDQRECLSSLGASHGQGYLWSPAIAAEAFGDLLLTQADAVAGPSLRSPARHHVGHAASHVGHLDSVLQVLAHEIRSPLAVVRGYASLIGTTEDPVEARRGCAAIERAAVRIDSVLEHLTATSRLEGPLDQRPIAVGAALADIVDDFGPTTTVDLRLSVHASPTTTVVGDPTQFGQAISNLITNALRFGPSGAPVEVALRADDRWVDIDVSDEGPGVDPADLGLIFRKYGRADPDGPGSGLGLYVARQIARAHGGNVLVRRRPAGHGATFTLRLPRRHD